MNTSDGNIFLKIATGKCPNCGKGDVFQKPKRLLFNIPKMHEQCEICGYHFEREPGYFLGAMYISYGLAVFQGLVTFLICHFFFEDLPTLAMIFVIIGVISLFSMRNFKLSRIIYMYIFPQ